MPGMIRQSWRWFRQFPRHRSATPPRPARASFAARFRTENRLPRPPSPQLARQM